MTKIQDELNSWMLHPCDLPIRPVSSVVGIFDDALGQEGWEVVLALPAPKNDTWDPNKLFTTRRAVANFIDHTTLELDAELPGSTLVRVIPSDADEGDVAVDDAETPGDASDDGGHTESKSGNSG